MGGGLGEGGHEVFPDSGVADFFLVFWSSFFRVCFLFVFPEGLGLVFWRPWVDFGAISGSFGSHFRNF